ncbi:hypothetical protein C7M84_002768 [Penaeus vannamei]|uniref:Uncharacterized protein n=1 Tax=Penaeus vannamei TaxID=6689 RepID=A0A3R7MJN1_PENVA|nr:hypothetical protein C7M84_002768 [Penaeus vannamei]
MVVLLIPPHLRPQHSPHNSQTTGHTLPLLHKASRRDKLLTQHPLHTVPHLHKVGTDIRRQLRLQFSQHQVVEGTAVMNKTVPTALEAMDRHLQALHMVVNPMLTSQLLLPKEILEDRRQHKEAMAEALHLEEVMVVHHLLGGGQGGGYNSGLGMAPPPLSAPPGCGGMYGSPLKQSPAPIPSCIVPTELLMSKVLLTGEIKGEVITKSPGSAQESFSEVMSQRIASDVTVCHQTKSNFNAAQGHLVLNYNFRELYRMV